MLLHKYGTIDKIKCVSGFASATHNRGSVVKRAVNRQDLSVPSFRAPTSTHINMSLSSGTPILKV